MKSSSRGRKILILLLLTPLLAAVVVAAWIHTVADRRWAAAQERIRELSAAFPPPKPRPADATSSEAAKEMQAMFVSAIRMAVQLRSRAQKARLLYMIDLEGTKSDEVLDDVSDVLDKIHEGARRSVASPADFPPSWRGEWDEETLEFIVNCIVLRSRRRLVQRKPDEAAEALLDGLPLMRFWGESEAPANRIRAMRTLVRIHDELRQLVSHEKLPPDALLGIDLELDRSEAWLQLPFRQLEPQLARWGESLPALQIEPEGLLRGAAYRWRYLLPVRLMKAEAFEILDRHTRALVSCEGRSYAEFLRCDEARWKEALNSLNPILRPIAFEVNELGWEARPRRAELRLLRTAARYRATGELLKLEDPFGDVLRQSESQDLMNFWSVGLDGMDDGGHIPVPGPGWRGGFVSNSKDLVIEVPKWKRD